MVYLIIAILTIVIRRTIMNNFKIVTAILCGADIIFDFGFVMCAAYFDSIYFYA